MGFLAQNHVDQVLLPVDQEALGGVILDNTTVAICMSTMLSLDALDVITLVT